MIKKLILALIFIVPMFAMSQEQFKTETRQDTVTDAQIFVVDTTETLKSDYFDLWSEQSIQVMTDTLKSGPVALKVELYTSNYKNKAGSFKLAQTLIDSTVEVGWLSIIGFNVPPARYGQLWVTGLTGNDSNSVVIYTNGWSNQPGTEKDLN